MDKMRTIDILLFDDLNILDVAGPVQAFSSANDDGKTRYQLRYVTLDGQPVTTSCGLKLQADRADGVGAQDLIIPGGGGVDQIMGDERYLSFIRNWLKGEAGRRLISICSGALVVAAAGLLDGRKATTHWGRERQARLQFPQVQWADDELYHIEGQIFTSAGVTSGIDLALEIIRRDHGSDIALSVARELVVYLKRSGGQKQFADLLEAQFIKDKELARLINALYNDPGFNWTLETMAEVAGLTPRTLSRRFDAQTGYSPAKFLERYRVKRACEALSSGVPVHHSLTVSGFADFQQMQRAFKRQLAMTVGRYVEVFAGTM